MRCHWSGVRRKCAHFSLIDSALKQFHATYLTSRRELRALHRGRPCTIGDAKNFDSGRQVAAWLGLVPRQHSSSGKANLLGMSVKIDRCLHRVARNTMHGAFLRLLGSSWPPTH